MPPPSWRRTLAGILWLEFAFCFLSCCGWDRNRLQKFPDMYFLTPYKTVVLPHPLLDRCTSSPLTSQMYSTVLPQSLTRQIYFLTPYQTVVLPHPLPDRCTSHSLPDRCTFSPLTRQIYFLIPYQTDLLPHPVPDRFTSSPRTRQMYFLTPYQTDVLLHPVPAHLKVWLQIQY